MFISSSSSSRRMPCTVPLSASLLLCFVSLSLSAPLRINVGGPYLKNIGFRSDLTTYISSPATVAQTLNPNLFTLSGSWGPVYYGYRWASSGNLEYKIPVASPGTYTVAALFMETWTGAKKANIRVFNIKINGVTKKTNVDVAKQVGFQKPLYIKFENIKPNGGFITFTVARIAGKQNPMLSGLVIGGDGADAKVGDKGLGDSGSGPSTPVKTTAPPSTGSGDPLCKTGIFGKNQGTGQLACCNKVCGKCGGSGCSKFAPGQNCCISGVNKTGKSCNTNGPPCVPSTDLSGGGGGTTGPTTTPKLTCPGSGLLGVNTGTGQAACCPKECGKCGGKGCGGFAPGKLCCISSVFNTGVSCGNKGPPCIPVGASSGGGSTPTSPPSTGDPVPGASCPISGATTKSFRMNVAGGAIGGASMGADNPSYISSTNKGQLFSEPTKKIISKSGKAPWDSAYSSHRWTEASVLGYKIPVPAGKYVVKLLFAETFFSKVGARKFDVIINGVQKKNDLDIFATVGKDVGLLLEYPDISPLGGAIQINLIKSVENPMISGIMIEGNGAGLKAVGGGCGQTGGKADESDLNGGFNHRSHSVPGGPYMATDFDNNGKALISFDGTQSHSHYQDPGPPEVVGKIVSYKWTWAEVVNGKKITKTNNDKSGKFTATFPLGKTIVTLEVVDSTGDVASDTTTVEVKGSTANGAYCYYYNYGSKTFSTVPLPLTISSNPKPLVGSEKASINFNSLAAFGQFPFSGNAFAVRCSFFIEIPKNGAYSYTVQHQGPFKLYHSGVVMGQSNSKGTTKTSSKNLLAGLNAFQLLYFRPKNLEPKLVLSDASGPLSSPLLQHDSASTLPVITGLSKKSSAPSGGENIQIYGSAFINGVSVKFGQVEASNLISSNPGVLQVTVPPGSGVVLVTVHTNAGISNGVSFTYNANSGASLDQPVIFKQEKIKNPDGSTFKISFIASAAYGPDGRLYLGSTAGKVYALKVDKNLKVVAKCEKQVASKRAVLGVAFSPFSNNLKMYFTTSALYWKDKNLLNFEQGWTNGKVETIEFDPKQLNGGSCTSNQQTLVSGLPVSNHDHAINKLQFLPNGKLLIGVGGFTNGGISVPGKKPVPGDAPDDKLGGVASNPLSAAIVICPANKKTDIKYSNYADPEKAQVTSGNECSVYASGLRNTFGMTLHTNGKLYAVDNGPNAGFGDFSTNCFGGKVAAKNIPDKLFLVQPGKWHGHPNLNRKECAFYPASAVQPLISNVQSSTNGIIEYRSNTFGGDIKGNLYMSKFSVQTNGLVAQVKLSADGTKQVAYAPNFLGFSGLSLVEGPRGELVMPRVYQGEIVVANPSYPAPKVTFMLGVIPRQGPASGGTKVLISGHNFGGSPQATFGGKKCTNVVSIDSESFTCITPPNSKNQKVSVVVQGAAGNSPSYGSDYWYM